MSTIHEQPRTPRKTAAFQMLTDDGRTVLEFHGRSRRPLDDTTVMSVWHRTTGGSVSVIVERDEIPALARWFSSGTEPLEIKNTQTTAQLLPRAGGGVRVGITWNGSGSGRTAHLTMTDRMQITAWLMRIDAHGWSGWKSGETL